MQTGQAINPGNFHILKPRKALNKAFLKVKPNRTEIEQFKANLTQLLDNITNENPAADTASLEAEIEQLVYQLYDLTDEEIQIIENSIS